ncbi:MAG: hypothetical protein IJ567_06365 [Lachnospiraceae bacterium]|nr:hypothetical protein [Lachnospiraceae bacterium]
MKWLGNVLAAIGGAGGILGVVGYFKEIEFWLILMLIGVLLMGIGYELGHQFVDYEEVIGSEIQRGKTDSNGLHKRGV